MDFRFRYEDLPPKLRARVDALWHHQRPVAPSESSTAALTRTDAGSPGSAPAGPRGGRRGPNKTESAYRREILGRRRDLVTVRFEALTFRMGNGHRYTPDWVVVTAVGCECHEVKGAYALQSQQRARLAFDQARVEFPWISWVWAVRSGNGWEITGGDRGMSSVRA